MATYRCRVAIPAPWNAALVGPQRGGQTTSNEPLGAAGSKRPRTVDFGTPYKKPMSSRGLQLRAAPGSTRDSVEEVTKFYDHSYREAAFRRAEQAHYVKATCVSNWRPMWGRVTFTMPSALYLLVIQL
ncbi:jg19094 [Pararge aegeria aegeria]|uniref:Jg19094 protein n=1 Tax=Pararge aegeria aegeria TaxID=348720 RepID=A0A8S4SQA2_9NEOP|nr:jg19094 [Pararge aegeria aegeria]